MERMTGYAQGKKMKSRAYLRGKIKAGAKMKKIISIAMTVIILLLSSGCATFTNKETGRQEVVVKSDAIAPVEIISALGGLTLGGIMASQTGSGLGQAGLVLGTGLFFYGFGSMMVANSYKDQYRNTAILSGYLAGMAAGIGAAIYEGNDMVKNGGSIGGVMAFVVSPFIIAGCAFIGAGLGNVAGHVMDIFNGGTGEGKAN